MAEIVLKVGGMRCPNCVKSITEKLRALDGVIKVSVSLEGRTVDVSFDESKTGQPDIMEVINSLGFETAGH